VKGYLSRVCAESTAVSATLLPFEITLADLRGRFDGLVKTVAKQANLVAEKKQALVDAVTELCDAVTLYKADAKRLLESLSGFGQKIR